MRKPVPVLVFFLSFCTLLVGQSTWQWGVHTHMGLSGWPRSEQGQGAYPDGTTYEFTAKERLQPTYGGGLWALIQPSKRWSWQLGLAYRKADMLAVGYYEQTDGSATRWAYHTAWQSEYWQLPILLRHSWGNLHQRFRPYMGIGVQPTYLWTHQYSADFQDVEGVPIVLLAGIPEQFTDEADLASEELERSRLRLSGLLEVGLQVNQLTMALSASMFFQSRRQEVPSYNRYLEGIEDGVYRVLGTPIRYVSSLDIKLYYAFN